MIALSRSADSVRSRASRPGSAYLRRVAIVLTFAVLLAVLGFGIDSFVSDNTQSSFSGSPANWLPQQQLRRPVGRQLTGTYSDPALTLAGDNVRVRTKNFTAMAVVTGPLVPGEGFTYQPQYVVATWTVHIWDVRGTIPLSAADFDSIDHLGSEFRLLPPQGTAVPKAVSTGGQVTFQLRAVVPIGEDLFRWAPDGNDVIAKWDNQVEND